MCCSSFYLDYKLIFLVKIDCICSELWYCIHIESRCLLRQYSIVSCVVIFPSPYTLPSEPLLIKPLAISERGGVDPCIQLFLTSSQDRFESSQLRSGVFSSNRTYIQG